MKNIFGAKKSNHLDKPNTEMTRNVSHHAEVKVCKGSITCSDKISWVWVSMKETHFKQLPQWTIKSLIKKIRTQCVLSLVDLNLWWFHSKPNHTLKRLEVYQSCPLVRCIGITVNAPRTLEFIAISFFFNGVYSNIIWWRIWVKRKEEKGKKTKGKCVHTWRAQWKH